MAIKNLKSIFSTRKIEDIYSKEYFDLEIKNNLIMKGASDENWKEAGNIVWETNNGSNINLFDWIL